MHATVTLIIFAFATFGAMPQIRLALLVLHSMRQLMDCLHWRRLRHNANNSNSHYLLALATLGVVT